MKTKLNLLSLLFLMFVCFACLSMCKENDQTGGKNLQQQAKNGEALRARKQFQQRMTHGFQGSSTAEDLSSLPKEVDFPLLYRSLDELAELERAGTWFQGLALTESGLRENAGDYAGAVTAAYKELSIAYGMGLIQKSEIEQGIFNVIAAKNEETVSGNTVRVAANAVLSFVNEQWSDAAKGLELVFNGFDKNPNDFIHDDPDSFNRWMMLVCTLEKNKAAGSAQTGFADSSFPEDRITNAAYKSIRARYTQFPEYWYRGARAFSGVIAAEFAENCINTSPQGPFAEECRRILALYTGLKSEEGLSIKTKKEIEAVISLSINSGNPDALDSLLPLIGLPDNPYTVYAVGALRALTSVPKFREYFNVQAQHASQKTADVSLRRLAERLTYICRG